MSGSDDGNRIDPKQTPQPHPSAPESPDSAGWLETLNAFLERANKADLDTGC